MAKSLNKFQVIGNLGDAPKCDKINDTDHAVVSVAANYTVVNNGDKETRTDWFRIEFWGGLAKVAETYLKKGDRIFVEGRMKPTSKEVEGVRQYFFNLVATELVMLGGSNGSAQEVEQAPIDDEIPF